MRIGNVIEAPAGAGKWIVTAISDRMVSAVSFDYENVTAGQALDDHERTKTCHCGDYPEFMGEPQADCEDCHGTGSYVQQIVGWKHSTVLASNVQEFILNGVKQMWKL